jgi:hypothetical protein
MKSLLTSLASAAVLALFTILPASAQDSEGETRAECLQRCFDQYIENLEACEDACYVCDTWIIFFCASGHTDQACFTNCTNEAKRVHEACKRECPPELVPVVG